MTATTTQADRFSNRAPRGGAVSPVNGLFYAGGRFMPMASDPARVVAKPAALVGSSRQVAWADRLRREELTRLEEELTVRRLILADPKPIEAAAVRRSIRRFSITHHRLLTCRSASAVIEYHLAGRA